MFWARKGQAGPSLRAQQIESLKRSNPAARAVTPDESTFDIGLRLRDGRVLTLRTSLPPDFPASPPIMQMLTPAQHPMLDMSGRVLHQQLQTWSPHTDIGRLLADVMQEFSMRPPQVPAAPAGYPQFHSPGHLPPGAYASHPQRGPAHAPGYGPPPRGPYPSASGAPPYPPASGASAFPPSAGAPPYPATSGTPSYPPSSASYPSPTYPRPPGHGPAPSHPSPAAASPASAYAHGAGTAASGYSPAVSSPPRPPPPYAQGGGSQAETAMPPVPDSFPELQHKSVTELRAIAKGGAALRDFLLQQESVKDFAKLLEELRDSNANDARLTLSRRDEVEQAQAEVQALMATVREEKAAFDQKAQRQHVVMQRFSADEVLRLLSEGVSKAEQDSDEIGMAFEHGEMDVKTFEAQFLRSRAMFHSRRAKLERYEAINAGRG